MYQRVLPRDLFNESKLLKCLGQIALLVHDGRLPLTIEDTSERGFFINQDPSSGELFCLSLNFRNKQLKAVNFRTAYNSKDPYPLFFTNNDGEQFYALHDDGTPTPELLSFLG